MDGDDLSRPLTNKGGVITTRIIKRLKVLDFTADRIFTSPYLIAKSIAEIALEEGLGK